MDIYHVIQQLYNQPETEVVAQTKVLRQRLGKQVLILGHHYQREEVIAFADITGDSLKLSQQAAAADAPYIIFCGVHFMAETADILSRDDQQVILPDLAAGCSMADMADAQQVNQAWQEINQIMPADSHVTPVTYINSTAAIKSFCGQHGGVVCTSSNAKSVLDWSWNRRDKVLFLPDQHLGRNTALAMGLTREEMLLWDPNLPLGGNSAEAIKKAKLLLWKGHCQVHQLFQAEHVTIMRQRYAGIEILAHPECCAEVCDISDFVGSTEAIIKHVQQANTGSQFAIGTELNLVNRLRLQNPDKPIHFLSPTVCMCSTMFRIDPQHLYAVLKSIESGTAQNIITVADEDKKHAHISLQRMLDLA
ncbi:MAG: quinolinate synthase NadA [Mariprofundales bacterium]